MLTLLHTFTQLNNLLHGKTLEAILVDLKVHFCSDDLAPRIALRPFSGEQSIGSGLKVQRMAPLAHEKVEGLYLFMLHDLRCADPYREAR